MKEGEKKFGGLGKDIFLKSYNLKEARERQGITMEQVEEFREKIRPSKIAPKIMVDNQIYLFINSCGGDIDKAVKKFERYYELKHQCPEFFANRDVRSEAFKRALDATHFVALPVTPDNYNLILAKIRRTEPKDYIFDEATKVFIMKSEIYTFNNGPRSGTIFIDDFEGCTFQYLFKPKLSSLKKGMKFVQEASPLDVHAIHILNTPWFVNYFMNMVKPFIGIDILQKLHFHPSNMDWEKFHEEHIPKSHLPSDYGGDLASIEELHTKQRESFEEMRDYFIFEEKHKNYELDQYYDEFMETRAEMLKVNAQDEMQRKKWEQEKKEKM